MMIGRAQEVSPPKRNGNSQTPRTVVITSVITAITTIVVSFLAIVPQLRQTDKENIQKLEEKVNVLERHTRASKGSFELKGQILSKNGEPIGKAEIYLIPATGSEHMTTSDDTGYFLFSHLDSNPHWIVVRDRSSMSTRGLIGQEETLGEVQLVGVTIKYKLFKE